MKPDTFQEHPYIEVGDFLGMKITCCPAMQMFRFGNRSGLIRGNVGRVHTHPHWQHVEHGCFPRTITVEEARQLDDFLKAWLILQS